MDFDSSDSVRSAKPLKYLQEVTFHEPLPEVRIVEAQCRLIDHFGIGRLRSLSL